MTVTVGRTVHYHAAADERANGAAVHPAIVTRVWSDRCVNLTVFFDNSPPAPRSSVEMADQQNVDRRWSWPPRTEPVDPAKFMIGGADPAPAG